MKTTKRIVSSLTLFVVIITTCFIVITQFSGFRYEYKKFKKFLLTAAAVIILRYVFLEHIEFFIQATIRALIDYNGNRASLSQAKPESDGNDNQTYKPMEYLKLRLNSLKSELYLDQWHKDEDLNLEYKQLTQEFWLFGKYLFLLLLLIIYSGNSFDYYNTAAIKKVLNESYFSNYKLEKVLTINDLYYWINDTLTSTLNEGYGYDNERISEPGWLHFHLAKLLGVVRLQQVRHAKKVNSMTTIYYDKKDYLPNWQEFNGTLHYIDKYWRIYHPWLSKRYDSITEWLMAFTHINTLYPYNVQNGYVVLLARDRQNSANILKFLKEQNWLDDRTAAIVIDFTLYNVDSNIFSICSLLVEQTPFGDLVWELSVHSVELLTNINEISMMWWLLIGLYILQLIQFSKVMIIRAWFISSFFKSRWNYVDFSIVFLNILLLTFVAIREYYVLYAMKTFVISKKVEFVDFRVACLFDHVVTVVKGLLIVLVSIRVWKILQYFRMFRIFNRTLYTSSIPLLSTVLGIHIFLCAVSLAAEILNSSQTEIFSRYLKSLTSIMSFCFGFNSRTNPSDLSHGGSFIGFLLYFILMFVVAIFLINMFITLIFEHFCNARKERDQEHPNKLTYWQFLKMEYSNVIEFFQKYFPSSKAKHNNATVVENIHSHLDQLERELKEQQSKDDSSKKVITEDEQFEIDRKRANRIKNVVAILNVQMEILNRSIMLDLLDWETEDEESN